MSRLRTSVYSASYRWALDRLVALREEAGMKQSDVAVLMKTSQTNISKLERGATRFGLEDLHDYLVAVGCHPAEFMMEYAEMRRLKPKAG